MKTSFFQLLFFLVFTLNIAAQFSTQPLSDKVKTLQVSRAGWSLSYPVIYLDRPTDAIAISFDYLEAEMRQITYSLIHCDANWHVSDLSVNEYMDGFQGSYVEDFAYSRSTNIDYVNYQLSLPNQDVALRLSGNYVVVFFDEDEQDTLATACFSVVEPYVNINGTVSGISTRGSSGKSQQLNFTVSYTDLTIQQPLVETKVVVIQNNDDNTKVVENTPTYIHSDRLVYEQHPDFSFPGRGEYRHFEASSVKYASRGVADISYYSPFYHFNLRPADLRQLSNYEFDEDINGKYVVRRQESENEDAATEADYIVVHFTVPMTQPIWDGKVYVGGNFLYNAVDKTSQMTYNTERKCYEASIMLKQGYYNYRYFVRSNRDGSIKSAPIEMDAFQTENDYQIFFYYHELGERYDRLVGYQLINSLNY